jgi:hypothetical protein
MNRDAVRSALSVFRCAALRDDLGPEEAMAAAIQTYLNAEERAAGQDPRFYRPAWPTSPGINPAIFVAIWLVGVVLVLAGCGTGPTATEVAARTTPCPVESLACFHSDAVLRVGPLAIQTEAWSEDMPTPGFANRWHYLLPLETYSALERYMDRTTDEVETEAVAVRWPGGQGGQTMEAFGHWRLEMRATDPAVSAKCAALAGAQERRKQRFTVRRDGPWVELLIEEPVR